MNGTWLLSVVGILVPVQVLILGILRPGSIGDPGMALLPDLREILRSILTRILTCL